MGMPNGLKKLDIHLIGEQDIWGLYHKTYYSRNLRFP